MLYEKQTITITVNHKPVQFSYNIGFWSKTLHVSFEKTLFDVPMFYEKEKAKELLVWMLQCANYSETLFY